MKVVWMNLVFYSFLGLTAYFVTPHVLWVLLAVQGFVDQSQNVTNTIKERIEND